MDPAVLAALIGLIQSEAPTIISTIKGLFASQNPTAPVLTDAQIMVAFTAAYSSSLATDQTWLSTHPAA